MKYQLNTLTIIFAKEMLLIPKELNNSNSETNHKKLNEGFLKKNRTQKASRTSWLTTQNLRHKWRWLLINLMGNLKEQEKGNRKIWLSIILKLHRKLNVRFMYNSNRERKKDKSKSCVKAKHKKRSWDVSH